IVRAGPTSSPTKVSTVGREVELAALERETTRAFEEASPQVVLLTGAPGIGKSRLADELVLRLRGEPNVRVLRARGRPHTKDRAYSLATSMLEGFVEARTADGWPRLAREAPTEERQHALYRLVAEAIEPAERDPCAEFMGALLGVEVPE